MSTFALDGGASQEELLSAVNYLLANLSPSNYSNEQTGEIINSAGQIIGYLYKYIYVKYADSFDGSTNFSDSPTNRSYYGIRNSDSPVESTNPTDYVWVKVAGGFGTTRFLWYLTTGGRQIQLEVAATQPNTGWTQDDGAAIDLDIITAAPLSPANFIVNRITNDSSAPTDVECIAAIGRTPISGDLCTVVYNSGISSILYRYTTGWAAYIKYISTDLILAGTIKGSNIDAATITGSNVAAATITGDNIAANTITADNIAANSITVNEINDVATGQIIAGSFNMQIFTSIGVSYWTCPDYVYKAKITVIGAGGGGGIFTTSGIGSGGGGGGGASISIITVVPGVTYTVVIGSGGTPIATARGSAGALSSFSGPGITSIVGNGGGGAQPDPYGSIGYGGSGGTATGGILNFTGSSGGLGYTFAVTYGPGGSAALIGAAPTAGNASANSGAGGAGNTGSGGSGLVIVEY